MSNYQAPNDPVLEVRNLEVTFRGPGGSPFKAVRGIDLTLQRGEVLGLVGESGCGKSTLARGIMQLIRPSAGSVRLEGKELCGLNEGQLRPLRPAMQMVFQDPYASLNPRMSIGDLLAEPQLAHGLIPPAEASKRSAELLDMVGLPASAAARYPHEFSGGQRQRVAIARALALHPAVLIADEPVSALDVSIQAQIINLLQDLVSQLNLGLVFIAHDLSVVKHVSDRVAVMYLGRVVETGPAMTVIDEPIHPYTQALIAAIPVPDPARARTQRPATVYGDPPSPLKSLAGCAFQSRCPRSIPRCQTEDPLLLSSATGHCHACLNPQKQ